MSFYSSAYIIWVIKCSRTRWARHTTHKGRRKIYRDLVEKTEEREKHLEDLVVDESVILKGIIKYSVTSNNGHCRGISVLSVIGGVR